MKAVSIFLFSTLLLLSISTAGSAFAASTSGGGAKVQASIPQKVDIRLYGYTAPNSIVQAWSVRVFAQVFSDKTGYFIIDPLPISQEAKEICLTTIDKNQRAGFPLCISLPETDKPTEIGPLLLSPTLSLSQASLVQRQDDQAEASGQTLPASEVEIYFFDNEGKITVGSRFVKLIRSRIGIRRAEAKSVPKLTTKTDKNGDFSINLPTNKVVAFRLFAKAFYDPPAGETGPSADGRGLPSPKSQTLVYTVSSYTYFWLTHILPKLILLLLALITLLALAWHEKKYNKGRKAWAHFSETRLKPFAIRRRLALRRIWYNFRGYFRSRQT